MGLGYWFRVGVMILGFAVIVIAIKNLNEYGLGRRTRDALGLSTPGTRTAQVVNQRIDLCETRIHALTVPGHERIYEKDLKWYRGEEGQKAQPIDFIDMEKWLSRNCTLRAEKMQPQPSLTAQAAPALIVDFIKGAPETLKVLGHGLYIWKNHWFRSGQLDYALGQLGKIPDAKPPGAVSPSTDR